MNCSLHSLCISTDLESKAPSSSSLTWGCKLFLVIMNAFNFLYLGAEASYGVFLTTFMVKSSLHTTKTEGAFLSSLYWGAFAITR